MPSIHLPDVLRRFAGGSAVVAAPAGTGAEVLEALFGDHPELRTRVLDDAGRIHPHLSVFRGGVELGRDEFAAAMLEPGDRIDLLVAVVGGSDVRMRGFRERATVEEALAAALEGIAPLPAEEVAVTACAGRVLAEPAVSEVDVPPFRRATMDGYAVRSEDTYGAALYNPVVLGLAGEAMPGAGPESQVAAGTAVRIMTGSPVPEGADAVLRAEDAEEGPGGVTVRAAVPAGRNVGRVGEDVDRGTEVLPAGRLLLAQDAGLLAAVGHDPVGVHRRPRVRVIVSGNELLAPGARPAGSKIVDSNSVVLTALVERDGGEIEQVLRLPDGREPMREALEAPGADVVVTSGAVSVGREDYTPLLVAELGELAVHGVAMRPSSPTGVGSIGAARVILLPGNPVSCLVAYDFFAGPVIRRLGGRPVAMPYPVVALPLRRRLVSQIGRTDYARMRVMDGAAEPLAVSGASVLSSVTRADGFTIVPAGSEGYPEGETVEVYLYGSELAR